MTSPPWPARRLTGPLRSRVLLVVVALLATAAAVWLFVTAFERMARREDAWHRLQRTGVLRVGMDASFPPFEAVNGEGDLYGLDVDLARELGARWGVKVAFSSIHFDGLYDALQADRIDLIISALPYDRTMTRDVLYSSPYFDAGLVLVARPDSGIAAPEDLTNRAIAVELGAEAHHWVRHLAREQDVHIAVHAEREADEVLERVLSGEADALVCDRVTALGYIAQAPDLELVAGLTEEPLVIAARPDSPLLMAQVQAALEEWRQTSWLAALHERWFGIAPGS